MTYLMIGILIGLFINSGLPKDIYKIITLSDIKYAEYQLEKERKNE